MPRQARLDAPGVLQHVMARGIEKTRIFCDEGSGGFFFTRLGEVIISGTSLLSHC
jgi:hypothetical protein